MSTFLLPLFQIAQLLHYTHCASSRTDYTSQILQSSEGQWGDWSDTIYCHQGQWAYTFNFKSESDQGTSDDTAANGVRLICKTPSNSADYPYETSSQKFYGSWYYTTPQTCGTNQWLVGFRSRVEIPCSGIPCSIDDVALSCIQMICSDGIILEPTDCRTWGNWGSWTECTVGYICGFQEKYDPDQISDQTALNAVRFHCCNYETNKPSLSPSRFPTKYPTNSPTQNPSLNPSLNPTISPTNVPTVPTVSPVLPPKTTQEKSVYHLLFVCYYNDDNGEHYKSLIQLITTYANIMKKQILDSFESVNDEQDGEISEFTMCTLFNDQKLTDMCGSFELNDNIDVEYVAFGSFSIVHFENALKQFEKYIIIKMESDEFRKSFTDKMNIALEGIDDGRRRNLLQNNFEAISVQIIDELSTTSTTRVAVNQFQNDGSHMVLILSISVVVGVLVICALCVIIVVVFIYFKKKQRLNKINDMEGGRNHIAMVKYENKHEQKNEGINDLIRDGDQFDDVEHVKHDLNVAQPPNQANEMDDDDIIQAINETKIASEQNALIEGEIAKPMDINQTAGYNGDFNEMNDGQGMLHNDADVINVINETNIGVQNDGDIIEAVNETHDGYM